MWYILKNRRNCLKNHIAQVAKFLIPYNGNDSFYQQIGLKFEEETNKMLHLEHGFLWC